MKRRAVGYAVKIGTLAGLVGGLAEVAWISIYAAATGADPAIVARGVTLAVGGGHRMVSPVIGGIAIHMGLAALLGIAIALTLRPIRALLPGIAVYAAVTAALAIVWMVNLLVLLPLISPQLVDVVPYGVSFLSKLLFGVSAAWIFQAAGSARPGVIEA